jgi:hypothetical protein
MEILIGSSQLDFERRQQYVKKGTNFNWKILKPDKGTNFNDAQLHSHRWSTPIHWAFLAVRLLCRYGLGCGSWRLPHVKELAEPLEYPLWEWSK